MINDAIQVKITIESISYRLVTHKNIEVVDQQESFEGNIVTKTMQILLEKPRIDYYARFNTSEPCLTVASYYIMSNDKKRIIVRAISEDTLEGVRMSESETHGEFYSGLYWIELINHKNHI